MKLRNGFVSNSSSTSFIVKNVDEMEIAKRVRLKVYKVSDMIKRYHPAVCAIKAARETMENLDIPSFLNQFDDTTLIEMEYDDLIELENKYPDCYLTDSMDRDYIDEEGVTLEEYRTDL